MSGTTLRWLSALLGLTVAALSLWLAVPRVIASVARAPAYGSVRAIFKGHISDEQIERAVEHLEAASRWENSRRVRTDGGPTIGNP